MAVPTLPSDMSAGNTFTASRMNGIYDLLAWFRDDRPIFKGQADLGGPLLESGTTSVYGFGDSGGSFHFTPSINVGGWDVPGSGGATRPLLVPEPGIYLGFLHTSWPANSTGYRFHDVRLNGSLVSASAATIEATSTTTRSNSTFVLDATAADDEIDVRLLHNAGSDLDPSPFLTLIWMQST